MERPDLHALATTTREISAALGDLRTALDEAENAALGEWDESTETAVEGTGTGDDAAFFKQARGKVITASIALGEIQDILATVQGYRDFEREPVA